LSKVPVIVPKVVPAGVMLQGYEIPFGGGVSTPGARQIAIVNIDFAGTCDPGSPALMQLEETTLGQPASPILGTPTRLNLGGKSVSWLSGDRADTFGWRANKVSFLLTLTTGAVPVNAVERMIAAMPSA